MKNKKVAIGLVALIASLAMGAGLIAACDKAEDPPVAHEHAYGSWIVTPPTQNAAGVATKTCPDCGEETEGHSVTLTLPALGEGGYTASGDTATCTEKGTATYAITLDGETVTFTAETPAKGHEKTAHAAVVPNCTGGGSNPYWECTVCHKYFSDADCTEEIGEGEWETDEVGAHSLTPHPAVAGDCGTAGSDPYWECSVCHKYFSDAQGEHEEQENDWIVPPTGEHDLQKHAEKASDCLHEGNIEYWSCSVCHKNYREEDCINEIEGDGYITARSGHTFTDDWTFEPAPTNDAGGTARRTCTVCEEETESYTVPALTVLDEAGESGWRVSSQAYSCVQNEETRYTYFVKEGVSVTYTVVTREAVGAHTYAYENVPAAGTVRVYCTACGEDLDYVLYQQIEEFNDNNATAELVSGIYLFAVKATNDRTFTITTENEGILRLDFTDIDGTRPLHLKSISKDGADVTGQFNTVNDGNGNLLSLDCATDAFSAAYTFTLDDSGESGNVHYYLVSVVKPFAITEGNSLKVKYLDDGDDVTGETIVSVPNGSSDSMNVDYVFVAKKTGTYRMRLPEDGNNGMIVFKGVTSSQLGGRNDVVFLSKSDNAISNLFEATAGVPVNFVFSAAADPDQSGKAASEYPVYIEETDEPILKMLKPGYAIPLTFTNKVAEIFVDPSVPEARYELNMPFNTGFFANLNLYEGAHRITVNGDTAHYYFLKPTMRDTYNTKNSGYGAAEGAPLGCVPIFLTLKGGDRIKIEWGNSLTAPPANVPLGLYEHGDGDHVPYRDEFEVTSRTIKDLNLPAKDNQGWVYTVAPTETMKGRVDLVCACGAVIRSVELPAYGDAPLSLGYTGGEETQMTCEQDGFIAYSYAFTDRYTYYLNGDPHEVVLNITVNTKKITQEATGHDFVEFYIAKNNNGKVRITDIKDLVTNNYCIEMVCSHEWCNGADGGGDGKHNSIYIEQRRYYNYAENSYFSFGEKLAPTCETEGIRTVTLTDEYEGKTYTASLEEPIPALGHNYTWDYGGMTAPTAEQGGSITGTCSQCTEGANHTVTVDLPALTDGAYAKSHESCTEQCDLTYTYTYTSETCKGSEIAVTLPAQEAQELICHEENLTGEGCLQSGTLAYWECPVCGKYWANAEATEEMEANGWVVKPKKSHGTYAWEDIPDADGTGGTYQYACSVCHVPEAGKVYRYDDGLELTKASAPTAPTGELKAGTTKMAITKSSNTMYYAVYIQITAPGTYRLDFGEVEGITAFVIPGRSAAKNMLYYCTKKADGDGYDVITTGVFTGTDTTSADGKASYEMESSMKHLYWIQYEATQEDVGNRLCLYFGLNGAKLNETYYLFFKLTAPSADNAVSDILAQMPATEAVGKGSRYGA